MNKIIFIFILNLIVLLSFGQKAEPDTISKKEGHIQSTIKYGNLIIQTIPSDVLLEIPKLGINEEKNQDSLILEEVYAGVYELSFSINNSKFKCFVEVIEKETVYVLVNVKEKRFETNRIDYDFQSTEIDPVDLSQTYIMVEEMPEFPGGVIALRKWIKSNVKYPESARREKITGRVYIGFVINREGQVEDCKVLRSIDPALDREALNVIKSMPRWKPGKQKGESVKVSYTFPINFYLH